MSDQSKIVIEAHKIRTATATAVLLHGSRRGPRDLRNPFSALIASFILAAVLLVAIAAATMISKALDERRQQQQRRPVGNAVSTATDQPLPIARLSASWGSTAPIAAVN